MANPEKIIVGLGNPGERYARNRHNVGFMVVDALALAWSAPGWRAECASLITQCRAAGKEILLAKPLTFMNLSGRAVTEILDRCGTGPESLVVVTDDLNLPFGRIRVRERGSAGGHHGLESILAALNSDAFVRVRAGIGESDLQQGKADFVLSDFPSGRAGELALMIGKARDAVASICSEGVSRAMSTYNAQSQLKNDD